MDWIHCNACWVRPSEVKDRRFMLTNCGHLFCDTCLKPDDTSQEICKVCGRECSKSILTSNMGPDIQEFFTCAEDLVNKFSRVLTFQNGHRQRITSYLFNVNAKYKILKKETQRLAEAIKTLEKKVKEKDKELSRLRYQLSCRTSGTPTNSRPPSAGSHPSPYFPTPSSQGSPIMGPPNRPTPGRSSHNFNELYQSKLITPNRLTLPRRTSPVSNNSSPCSQYSISPGNFIPSSINGSPVHSFNNKLYRSRQVSSPGTPLTPRTSQLLSPESPAYNKYCSMTPKNIQQSGSRTTPTMMSLGNLTLNSQQQRNSRALSQYYN